MRLRAIVFRVHDVKSSIISSGQFKAQQNLIRYINTTKEYKDSALTHLQTLAKLGRYLWPKATEPDAIHIKLRVVTSFTLLTASKAISIYVPFIFKNLVDHFQAVGILTPNMQINNCRYILTM